MLKAKKSVNFTEDGNKSIVKNAWVGHMVDDADALRASIE